MQGGCIMSRINSDFIYSFFMKQQAKNSKQQLVPPSYTRTQKNKKIGWWFVLAPFIFLFISSLLLVIFYLVIFYLLLGMATNYDVTNSALNYFFADNSLLVLGAMMWFEYITGIVFIFSCMFFIPIGIFFLLKREKSSNQPFPQ